MGPDYVYRDPWGNPYVITLDLNHDRVCRDAYYGNIQGQMAIWSTGPDGHVEPTFDSANPSKGYNKDNIKSWE